ncbi:LytTR family DNA-binding domain-containing protein [Lysinibacillus piscis]|uniref:LytR family transcriptional regulator n=1 Tax=Lysinibacillus piscis TaxID=2518931 RepID=A0ABQ5NQ26_9BACI|nr:LytTR family DNA-binding domain-containing protein [Lysinibacillus sp. KH24]GLC90201.1 LytR family transcriptional regulator [Lysinibacillus sp. KH24]
MEHHALLSNAAAQQFLSILKDLIPTNSSIAIAAQNAYIYLHSEQPHIQVGLGESVQAGSIAEQVLLTRKQTDPLIDYSLSDIPYYGVGYPIEIKEEPAALIVLTQKVEPVEFLTGKRNEEWIPIAATKISHLESLQKKTWFYINGEQFKTNFTLKELQVRLPTSFIRIHRSYIVNIHAIKKIARDLTSNLIVTLEDGHELPVSQSYITNLRNALEF